MRIKRYVAPDMATALAQVRCELGSEALLLEVRRVRRGWLARLGLRPAAVEVLAAGDLAPAPAAPLRAEGALPTAHPAAGGGDGRGLATAPAGLPFPASPAAPAGPLPVPVAAGGGRVVALVGPVVWVTGTLPELRWLRTWWLKAAVLLALVPALATLVGALLLRPFQAGLAQQMGMSVEVGKVLPSLAAS